MNRSKYFNFIEEKLNLLATRIIRRGRLNILDLNLHSENFYRDFLNLLFGWNLKNLNEKQQNAPGTDLINDAEKLVVQVSATATKQKVESSLAKLSAYKGYSFKFVAISTDAKKLRGKTYNNPHGLVFLPNEDIFDIQSLLSDAMNLSIERQQELYEFVKRELKSEPNPDKTESNLTTIITFLSKEDWSQKTFDFETRPFDIEAKITYNQLDKAKVLVDDYKTHYSRINKIYAEFDRQGANKSLSILNSVRDHFWSLCSSCSPDDCFFKIIDRLIHKIQESANYSNIPEEEIRLCVGILVVDAFMRCKIFKNPSGYNDACS